MNRPTLSQFRAQWPEESMGVCSADPKVAAYCNDAQDRLLMDPMAPEEGWWGGWITLALTVNVTSNTSYVTTPREICRLTDIAVCQDPLHIRNGFYEYLKWGAGLQPKTCAPNCGGEYQAYERDTVYTLKDLTTTNPQTVRIYPTDSRDIGRRVLLQGLDANGMPVTTTDPNSGKTASGEYIVIKNPFADSANLYTKITGIQKDETYGSLQFYQVDSVTALEVALSSMEPSEGVAAYRRYLITGIPTTLLCCNPCQTPNTGLIQITAQGRLEFIPVQNETDYLTIPNVPALIEEAQSIRFSRMDSGAAQQNSQIHHMRALQLLNGQLDKYEGKVSTAVKVPIFGSARLTPSFR